MWVSIYEGVVARGELKGAAGYPVVVNNRFIMATTPIPRWDIPKLHQADALFLFGAGREKRLYAVPPYTDVEPLEFEDVRFQIEQFPDRVCLLCGRGPDHAFLDETPGPDGEPRFTCNDTASCEKARAGGEIVRW
jgi:alpha-D-ribose 1-methylphosphonate 5-phosphate C-P lyase